VKWWDTRRDRMPPASELAGDLAYVRKRRIAPLPADGLLFEAGGLAVAPRGDHQMRVSNAAPQPGPCESVSSHGRRSEWDTPGGWAP
jgi:hypothetical protein